MNLHRKEPNSKNFDTYVVGVNSQHHLQDQNDASTTLRSTNRKGAQSEATRLDLPTMWSNPPHVHQDKVSAEMCQQRGTPVEDL